MTVPRRQAATRAPAKPPSRAKAAKPPPARPAKPATPRRRNLLWRAAGVVLGAVALCWCGGFLWFLLNTYSPSVPPVHADGIVVLTGGGERLKTAFQLLSEQRADRLLISGVPEGVGLNDVARSTHLAPPPEGTHVTVGHQALTTLGNAEETAAWAQRHSIHSLIVVTAGYHMPRALLELSRVMPGVRLYPMRVQPPAIYDGAKVQIWRLLLGEYTKWLLAQLDASRGVEILRQAGNA
jgi:uncharacterized SAM-binding protein YcdF (DUF218 family)